MAGETAIRVSGLSKSYLVGHESAGLHRYVALRDVLTRGAQNFARKTLDMLSGRPVVQGDHVEEFWALRDVSFEVKPGEVVGVIGRNGAGKSTLLKILSRITEPTEGRVEITGRVASLLEVGTGFHPELTGRENIYLNGAILGMTRNEIRAKFDAIVDFAEIERFLDTPVKRYSSGMYVRLAFAVAAHLEPEILVVDEVLAVGDAEFQRKCLGKMHDIAGNGRTVLFVSHNIAAVNTLCTRGLLLSGGRVVLDSDVERVVQQYAGLADTANSIVFTVNGARPSITRISVDQTALSARDLIVDIEFASPWALQKPIGGVILRAPTGEPVWGSNGRFHSNVEHVKGLACGILRCEARGLPLCAGQYVLSVWLADWHEDYDGKIDVLSVAIGNNNAGSLRPPASIVGHLDWPANWSVGLLVDPLGTPRNAAMGINGRAAL